MRRPARRPWRAAALGVLALAVVAAVGCRRQEDQAPRAPGDLETVDVAPPPDVNIDPSRDVQEVRRAEAFSGVLPSDYPAGLPLPHGASLVDQGPRWVALLVPRPPAAVRDEYLQKLRAAGWSAEAGGRDAWTVSKGATRARTALEAQGPSTRIRVDY